MQREVVLPLAHPEWAEARMDLVIYTPDSIAPVYVDVSIVSALSQEALKLGPVHGPWATSTIGSQLFCRELQLTQYWQPLEHNIGLGPLFRRNSLATLLPVRFAIWIILSDW